MARRRRRRRRISNHQSQTSFTPRSFYWIRYIFTPWQCVWTIFFRFVKCTPAITMVWPSAHTHVATGETSVIDIPEKPISRSSGHVPPPPPHHHPCNKVWQNTTLYLEDFFFLCFWPGGTAM
ncbi:hypothetical protein OIU77_005734, partial [Salix suchowensis]